MGELDFIIVKCPRFHEIIVAQGFPFDYKSIKCRKCMKEYALTNTGKIRYENGKAVSKPITGE